MLATRIAVAIAGIFAAVAFTPSVSSTDAPKQDAEIKEVPSALEAPGPTPIETQGPAVAHSHSNLSWLF